LSQSKYELVKEGIRERISSSAWKPGDRILSERDLAAEFHVSRITVKKAVSDLLQEGLLEHIPGKRGTFVREKKRSGSSTRLIGVAIDDVRDSFGSKMLRGIEDFLWDRRFHTLICNGDRDFVKIEGYFNSLLEHNISGVVFCPVIDRAYVRNNSRILSFLRFNRLPFVLMDRFVPGTLTSYVGANHRESSKQITDYLIQAGHTRIAIAAGIECTSMAERLQGYRDSLAEAGIPFEKKLVIRSNDNLLQRNPDSDESDRMAEQIRKAGDFSCFYALNSRLLFTGIAMMLKIGRKPGSEVAIASHDEPSKHFLPYTVNIPHTMQPCYQMGWEAARILIDHIREPDAPIVQMILKSRFVEPTGSP
jgi:GntR family transcriptional regulator of arabinose operon